MGRLEFRRQVHGMAVKNGVVTLVYVRNSLMDMYFIYGLFHDAAMLFQRMGDRDIAFMELYNHRVRSPLTILEKLVITFRSWGENPALLHASVSRAALNWGTLINDHIIKTGFVKIMFVASSLITMYANCGSLVDAAWVSEEIENWIVVCWITRIAVYQQHGCADQGCWWN